MEYNILKDSIKAVIKENGNGEITGQLLQDTLLAVVNSLGTGYQCMGVVTSPEELDEIWQTAPDQKVFYFFSTSSSVSSDWYDLDAGLYVIAFNDEWFTSKIALTFLENMQRVTWSALKTLRDSGQLVPGAQYRIIDYTTTTAQESTRSAGHRFDIIVTADSESILNENARAIPNSIEGYFDDCNLSAWRLKYCLDNDTARFSWADEENGKGVIYQLVDEYGNEAPFDFKNIQFFVNYQDLYEQRGNKDIVRDILCEPSQTIGDTWFYLFSWWGENGVDDLSIVGNHLKNDEAAVSGVYSNVVRLSSGYDIGQTRQISTFYQSLPKIIFCASYKFEVGLFYGLKEAHIEGDSYNLFIGVNQAGKINIQSCARTVIFSGSEAINISYCGRLNVDAADTSSSVRVEFATDADFIFPQKTSPLIGYKNPRGTFFRIEEGGIVVEKPNTYKRLTKNQYDEYMSADALVIGRYGGEQQVWPLGKLNMSPNDPLYDWFFESVRQAYSEVIGIENPEMILGTCFGEITFKYGENSPEMQSATILALVESPSTYGNTRYFMFLYEL